MVYDIPVSHDIHINGIILTRSYHSNPMVQWFLGQTTRSTSSECWIEQANLTASQNASKLLEPLIESLKMGMVSTGKNLKFSDVLTRKACDFTSQIMVSLKWTWCWLYSQRYGFWQQTSLVRQQTRKHLGFQWTLGCHQQKWSVKSWGLTGIYHDLPWFRSRKIRN